MVAINKHWRFSPTAPNPVPPAGRLAERVRRYFARHPEVSREEFLLDAVAKELTLRDGRSPLTEEDVRFHARLNKRLAVLHHERYGLWPKVRRLLFGESPS